MDRRALWKVSSRGSVDVVPAKFYLAPTAAILPTSNPAAITRNAGTNWTDYTLDYDATTAESAFWHVILPSDQIPKAASIDIFSRQVSLTTGTVGWTVTTLTRADGEAWDTAGNSDTVTADAVEGTAGNVHVQTAALTITGWAGSEMLAVKIARDTGNDTVAQDAKFMGAIIRLA